ncbi:GerAB/ArcD/ProY family transporter [Ectobacillus panaciterrae]|uniref:GerAB/ArcD/ProY family transporter n=1 Tax=Ectobacillus panaciterrae TaxID=363872 RepID=UPI00040B970D|nr:GerAB/ArcD/ProY family transporter [Ectobacillus panaciterrae]
MEFHNILPIMGKGILPSIQGAIAVQAWFNDLFYMSFFLPFLKDPEKRQKWSMISVVAIVLTMMVTNLIAIFVLGGTVPYFVDLNISWGE